MQFVLVEHDAVWPSPSARCDKPSDNIIDARLLFLNACPIEHDFAGVAGFHELDGFAEFFVGKAVRDDRRDVEPGLDERGHFVPGFIHLASVNSFNGELVEDDKVPIDGGPAGHDPEQRDFSTVKHVRQNVVERFWTTGHFERNIEAFLHLEFFHGAGDLLCAHINPDNIRGHFAREIETVWINVGYNDMARASLFADWDGHATDWARPGDEHVFAHEIE